MPNHIHNVLTLHGKPKDVAKVWKHIEGTADSLYIDFNTIVPMPSDLSIGDINSDVDRAKILIAQMEADTKTSVAEHILEHMDEYLNKPAIGKALMNYAMYGYTDWYSWRVEEWGTKWNSYENAQLDDNAISFQTAWASPLTVIKKLSKLFPTVRIELNYADEDLGSNCGFVIFEKGKEIDSATYGDEEGVEFACDVWGYDYEEIKAQMSVSEVE
jgi:hypothetical protein